MILRFGVENYRSFREPVEISFVSTARKDEPDLRFPASGTRYGVLPVLGVWGGNATGKSNLVSAILELSRLVEVSFASQGANEPLKWTPWRMEDGPDAAPTTFSLDLMVDGVRHHYGFRFRASGIDEEWLFYWPSTSRRILFHRNHDEEDPWYIGPSLRGNKSQILEATRRNALFLSTAAQFNHEQLSAVARLISKGIVFNPGHQGSSRLLFHNESQLNRPERRAGLVSLLHAADIGVSDIRFVPDLQATEGFVKVLSKENTGTAVRELLTSISSDKPFLEPRLVHGTESTGTWEAPTQYESQGTITYLSWLEGLMYNLASGRLMVADEIDTSLHPELVAALVGLFTSPESNPNGAQLLFSTHDLDLLSHLRTDEVLLVDKTVEGESQVSVASDYKGVRSRDDIRRAYIQGRLRGLPALRDLSRLFAEILRNES